MEAYILKGDPKEVDKVLRENRIRISRGVVSITPAEPDAALDVERVKMSEELQRVIAERNTLADLTSLVLSIAVDGGLTIPEDAIAQLGKLGIAVPQIAETVPDRAEDNKDVEVEDTKEAPAPTPKKTRSKKSE